MEAKVEPGALGVPGNLEVQSRLGRYLQSGRLHHAVILGGPAAASKILVAKNIAKFFLCRARKGPQFFCGACSECRRIENEIHPDVFLYREPEEDTLKVEWVRQVSAEMEIAPLEGKAKICIVDECHRMTGASANAFLKTLEEPRPNRFFWLLTSKTSFLLPTIRSRCIQFLFHPEKEPLIGSQEMEFTEWLTDWKKTRSLSNLSGHFDKKPQAVEFIRFIQRQSREAALGNASLFADLSWARAVSTFEAAVEIEGRLRSNANSSLMLESFLMTHVTG